MNTERLLVSHTALKQSPTHPPGGPVRPAAYYKWCSAGRVYWFQHTHMHTLKSTGRRCVLPNVKWFLNELLATRPEKREDRGQKRTGDKEKEVSVTDATWEPPLGASSDDQRRATSARIGENILWSSHQEMMRRQMFSLRGLENRTERAQYLFF